MSTPPPSPLSPDLSAFIEGSVPSVWALELLLLLRQQPEESWNRSVLVSELRANDTLVSDCLGRLARSGLVLMDGESARYAPAAQPLRELCDQLAEAYRERPVAVVNIINARRPDPLKGFAESFRLKGWSS